MKSSKTAAVRVAMRTLVIKDHKGRVVGHELNESTIESTRRKLQKALSKDSYHKIILEMGDCEGGQAKPALDLALWIESEPRISTHAKGRIQSSATFIFLAGKERTGTEDSSFGIHSFAYSTPRLIISEIGMEFARAQRDAMTTFKEVCDFIVRRTDMRRKEVMEYFNTRRDVIFDMNEARKSGIITKKARGP